VGAVDMMRGDDGWGESCRGASRERRRPAEEDASAGWQQTICARLRAVIRASRLPANGACGPSAHRRSMSGKRLLPRAACRRIVALGIH